MFHEARSSELRIESSERRIASSESGTGSQTDAGTRRRGDFFRLSTLHVLHCLLPAERRFPTLDLGLWTLDSGSWTASCFGTPYQITGPRCRGGRRCVASIGGRW